LSQAILVGGLFYLNYKAELQTLDESILSKMRVCNFDLQCDEFQIDFVDKNSYDFYRLYKGKNALSAYFSIPNSQKNDLQIYLPKDRYEEEVAQLQEELLKIFFTVLFFIAVLSLVFSMYALYPFRNALRLTEEFIKDILHDFNTPLSTLRLNASMLKDEIGENPKINRIEKAVQNILNLQDNLRSYLRSHSTQKTEFNLAKLLHERVALLEDSYKDISFIVNVKSIALSTSVDGFTSVIDNLLTSAAQYRQRH